MVASDRYQLLITTRRKGVIHVEVSIENKTICSHPIPIHRPDQRLIESSIMH